MTARTAPHPGTADPPEPDPPLLSMRGGGGGDGRWDQQYWVWGLPPTGPLGLVVEWREMDLDETRVDVDAQPLLEAAARAETVWDG